MGDRGLATSVGDRCRQPPPRASTVASGSTPSSCPRAATGRCCAWPRWSSTSDDGSRPQILADRRARPGRRHAAGAAAGRPGDRGRAARRPPGRGDPAPHLEDRDQPASSTRSSRPGSPARSAQAGYGNLLGAMLGRRVGKTASYTRWDARPLTAEQLSYAAEDVAHLLELADELQRRLTRQRPAELGPRGVPPPRVRDRRARPRHRLGAPAPRRPARPAIPRGGARAGGLARAHRELRGGPAGGLGARRSAAGRAGQAPARRTSAALEQIRGIHPSGDPAPRPGDPRGDRRGPRRRRRSRATSRAERTEPGDAPLIALAEALLRARALEAGLAYELIASRSELEQIVGAARRGEPEPERAHARGLARGARRRRPARPARRPQRDRGGTGPAAGPERRCRRALRKRRPRASATSPAPGRTWPATAPA